VVRRLGVDYHLEARPTKASNKTPVNNSRFREAAQRVIRLRRHFPNGSPGLFAAGINPVADYGHDHIRSAPAAIKAMQKKAVTAGNIRPFGTPASITLLAYPVSYDPGFRAVAQPIMRWAREVWMQDHPTDTHPDRLSPEELRQAQRLLVQPDREALPQGPLAAVAEALRTLQWTMALPHACGPVDNPLQYDMTIGSPSMLAHFIRRRYETVRLEHVASTLNGRPTPLPSADIHWPLVTRFLRSSKIPTSSKAALLSFLYGAYPSPAWLWAHGWQTDNVCLHCQQPLSARHVLNGCDSTGLYDRLITALRSFPIPTPRTEDDIFTGDIVRKVQGFPDAWPQFQFVPGVPLFTDGSAIHVKPGNRTSGGLGTAG
jgi:hypothetical protein